MLVTTQAKQGENSRFLQLNSQTSSEKSFGERGTLANTIDIFKKHEQQNWTLYGEQGG
jgi:hypothetical protein